jgi:hypothetical protein
VRRSLELAASVDSLGFPAGYSWSDERVNPRTMRLVSIPGAVALGVGAFKLATFHFRRFFFTPENLRRITRASAIERDFAANPPALTPARIWRMLGPQSTPEASRLFLRVYGKHLLVWGNAFIVAFCITASLHPVLELPFTVNLSESARALAERQLLEEQRLEGLTAERRHVPGPSDYTRSGTLQQLEAQRARGSATLPSLLSSEARR